ncbi:hypothetical protein [Hyphomonas sp.]|uniref:hypothetical protein n=1 Tax=Hyphomonas sp. TaxID=87 RepID=UPI0030FBC691
MLKWIMRLAAALAVFVIAAGWWLFAGFSKAPAAAPGLLDIDQWRSMIRDAGGDLPTEIRVLEVGHDSAPMLAARAGAFTGQWLTSYNSVQVVFPDSTLVIGGALDRSTSEGMVQSPEDWSFDDAAYRKVVDAMLTADKVLMTHEHPDHVMAIARHPDPDALAPRLWLNAPQSATLPQFANGELPAVLRDLPPRLDGTVQWVAPGVVAIPMAGHSPGAQLFFVTLQNGHEYLMIGDTVWSMSSIEDLTMRPVFTQFVVFDPDEDRAAIRKQVRAIHDLMQANPQLTVFPSHDRIWLGKLSEEGRIIWGFAD